MNKNYLMELSNDSNLSIRIPKELRDVFNEFCKKNLLNPSWFSCLFTRPIFIWVVYMFTIRYSSMIC